MPFETFWNEYPRKVGKIKAERAWNKLKSWEPMIVMQGLRMWKRSLDWRDPLYIPHASTFLNQRRWEESPLALVPERPNRGGTKHNGAVYSARDVAYYNELYKEHPELKPEGWGKNASR